MKIYPELQEWHAEFMAIRQDLHQHPELSYEEFRTSDVIAKHLQSYGVDLVHCGLGGTGVVATIIGKYPVKQTNRHHAIGLRADMDALPMVEENDLPYKSKSVGKMHGCGHDGHVAILLATAKYLAKHRNFAGKVHLIFQPAEEGGAGAKRMIDEGLFELFPIDSIWGLHNWPPVKLGKVTFCAGPMMASADELQFTLIGKGSHAARPHLSKDPILAAAQLIQAVQNLISREINPFDQAVISLCTIQGGSATNVIPDKVEIGGTLRSFSPVVRDHLVKRLYEVCKGLSQTSGVDIQMAIVGEAYPATINTALESRIAEEVAQEIFGTEHVNTTMEPSMGAEDFSYMLQQVPGCYIRLGSGITDHDPTLHQTNFNFNDAAIPLGASYFIKLVEKNLSHSV